MGNMGPRGLPSWSRLGRQNEPASQARKRKKNGQNTVRKRKQKTEKARKQETNKHGTENSQKTENEKTKKNNALSVFSRH